MKKKFKSLIWFRRDLRIEDNEALYRASEESESCICLFCWAPEEEDSWEPGGASKWWLHHALTSLQTDLKNRGADLIVRKGSSLSVLKEIIEAHQVERVYWNRVYDPQIIARDTMIKKELTDANNTEVISCKGSLLKEPWEIKNGSGGPYQVFTPFWRALGKVLTNDESLKSFPAPKTITAPGKRINSLTVDELELLPKIKWDTGFKVEWDPSESAALKILSVFISQKIDNYSEDRNLPSKRASSRLSPYLHFGQISPKTIWNKTQQAFSTGTAHTIEPFLRQLGWRDFAHHLLFHYPHTDKKPLKKDFERFKWKKNSSSLLAWQKGETGIPIIDAGMRELWTTGIMHNRVRMLVGSFLVKNLQIHWHEGASWFWDTLVDADLANNTLGWQWIAGCGADAAPYFRIFNPVTQSEKFDSDGGYIRRWVPELDKLPSKWIHKPWEASTDILNKAGVSIGKTYPHPIVNLKESRETALEKYYELRQKS